MKKVNVSIILAIILAISIKAQVPMGLKYQAVARDASGAVLANKDVTLVINILDGPTPSNLVYTESHLAKTNEFGLVNLVIGEKKPTEFAAINWGAGEYWISVQLNDILMGESQILSVPYALQANSATTASSVSYSNLTNVPTDIVKTTGDQSIAGNKTFTGTINAGSNKITNVATPTTTTDAANKAYVDELRLAARTGYYNISSNMTYTIADGIGIINVTGGTSVIKFPNPSGRAGQEIKVFVPQPGLGAGKCTFQTYTGASQYPTEIPSGYYTVFICTGSEWNCIQYGTSPVACPFIYINGTYFDEILKNFVGKTDIETIDITNALKEGENILSITEEKKEVSFVEYLQYKKNGEITTVLNNVMLNTGDRISFAIDFKQGDKVELIGKGYYIPK